MRKFLIQTIQNQPEFSSEWWWKCRELSGRSLLPALDIFSLSLGAYRVVTMASAIEVINMYPLITGLPPFGFEFSTREEHRPFWERKQVFFTAICHLKWWHLLFNRWNTDHSASHLPPKEHRRLIWSRYMLAFAISQIFWQNQGENPDFYYRK